MQIESDLQKVVATGLLQLMADDSASSVGGKEHMLLETPRQRTSGIGRDEWKITECCRRCEGQNLLYLRSSR